ncbi:MAG: tetratricopeptide repeat protein, partial [Pseudomonadota bacterium]
RKSRELTRPAAAARPGQAPPVDVYGLYLDALLSYVAGGAPDRAFNTLSPWLKHEIRGPLQMAYVNWRAGDVAQAADQFETYAEAAPQDWIALDALAAFQILRRTRQDERAAMKAIDQLTAANPAAGSFRRFQLAILQEDFEEAYATALTGDMAPKRLSADVLFGAAADRNDLLGAYRSLVMLSSPHEEGAASAPTEANPAIVNNANQGLALLHGVLAARRLIASGDRETAAAHLDRQLVAAPSFEPAILLRTLIDLEAGRLGDTVNRVEGGLSKTEAEAQDRHRSMRLLLARTLRAIAKDAAAAKALAPIADQLLEAEDTALFYAATLEAAGDGEALKLFAQRAQTVRAEPALAAMLFERAGDPGRAARLYREALFEAPLNGEHARRYAAAMEQAGRGTDAVALLEVLVRKNPEASGARAEIARLKYAVEGRPAVPASEPRAAVAIAMPAPAGPEDRLRVFDTAESGAIAFHVGQRFAEGSTERLAKVRIACFWGIEEACKEVAKTGS